jgi:hypothetical protein
MKYLLFTFIMLIITSCNIKGCNKNTEDVTVPPKGSGEHQCTSTVSCPIRLERLACALTERVQKGLIKWYRSDGISGVYFGLDVDDHVNVIVHKDYIWFNINVPPYDGTNIDKSVNNSCAKTLFEYLMAQTEDKTEAAKQKAFQDFLDKAEKKYEVPLEVK